MGFKWSIAYKLVWWRANDPLEGEGNTAEEWFLNEYAAWKRADELEPQNATAVYKIMTRRIPRPGPGSLYATWKVTE